MERDREFDEVLRKKISETLGEQIDESVDADDLMFDLGMRYLRMMAKKKRKKEDKKENRLSLWAENAASKKALVESQWGRFFLTLGITDEIYRKKLFYLLLFIQKDQQGKV